MARIVITEPATRDIVADFQWWRDNRSAQQAARWYDAIYRSIESLRRSPERCPFAQETDLLPGGIRQLTAGVNRPTHRILFTIAGGDVVILRVRHLAQDGLSRGDL